MHQAELFVALLVAVVLVALAARRLRHVPTPVALVLGGIGAGLLPFAPEVRLDPEVVFVVFLPPILYPAAFTLAFHDVRTDGRPIGVLAFGLVLATVGAIGATVHILAGIPWSAAFVLGAVMAATDPVAASAVIRSSGAPGRLATILEGESLINDGTSLTALRIAIVAVGGSFGFASALGDFVLIAFGGAAVGAVLGWLTAQLRRRLNELELETAITVLLAYGAFLLAERLGVSGVLAVVLAGYVMGHSDDIASPGTRIGGESFWSVAQFLGESILFLLVGLEFATLLGDPATRGVWELAGITALVVIAAVGVRALWLFGLPLAARATGPRGRDLAAHLSGPERLILAVSGLRGALSMAAALSIPATVDGVVFPERSTIVVVTVAAVVILLVVPALALPALLRAAGLRGAGEDAEGERRARAALAAAAVARVDALAAEQDLPADPVARVREHYASRARQLEDGAQAETGPEVIGALRREAVEAQRAELLRLRRSGAVNGELLRELQRALDVEDLRPG